jgi:hypothetical protein
MICNNADKFNQEVNILSNSPMFFSQTGQLSALRTQAQQPTACLQGIIIVSLSFILHIMHF